MTPIHRAAPPVARAAAAVALGVLLALPGPAGGQDGPGDGDAAEGPTVHVGGLLRTGLLAGPGGLGRDDGFRIHDARLRASGRIGIVFDYFVQGEFDEREDRFRLLDARLSLPVLPELRVELGQFKAPFGREALQGKGEITFVERSRITQLVAPGRQVGVQLAGESLEGRLSYRGGVFNGNGRELENDGDSFLWAGRVSYNTVGPARFYDELVVEVGASLAFSEDSAAALAGLAEVPPGRIGVRDPSVDPTSFRGDRLLWGVDLDAGFRGFFLRGEYLRGSFDPEGAPLVPGEDPADGDDEVVAEGGWLEGGYNLWGAIEGVVRWDATDDFLETVDGQPADADGGAAHFLVFGLNLFPGYHTKIGLQYAAGLSGARRGLGLADGEFTLNAQVDF